MATRPASCAIYPIFVPTRVLVASGPTHQDDLFLESLARNCPAPEDCDSGNERVQMKECASGHFMHRLRCPAEHPLAPTEQVHFPEYEMVQLWFISYLHFHRFQLDVSMCDETEPIHYPHRRADTYRLWDLVLMTGAEPEVDMGNSMVMILNALFQCELNHFHFEDGVRMRDSYWMFGVRLVAFTTGFGQKTPVAQIVLQISSATSLLSFAEIIVELGLTYVIAERNHYYKLEHMEPMEPMERSPNHLHCGSSARGLQPQGARGLRAWGALLAGTTSWRPGSERWKPSCISGAPGRQTTSGSDESCCKGTAWPSTRRTRTWRAARRTTRVWPPCVCDGTLGRRSTASPRECTSARPDSDTTSRSGSPCCTGGRSAATVRRAWRGRRATACATSCRTLRGRRRTSCLRTIVRWTMPSSTSRELGRWPC